MPWRTRLQTQPASSSTSPTALNPEVPRRPRKEKVTGLSEMEAARISNRQVQPEEAIGAMSQEMSSIKGLLERLLVPQAPTMTRGDAAVEERRTEQQAARTTTHGKATSGRHTNSQQIPPQTESTQSTVPHNRKTNTKAGPSKPHYEVVPDLLRRPAVPPRSQEKERTERGPKPGRNVFDRLGQNAEEDLRIHLDAGRTSASSKKNDVPTFTPMHD